MVRYGENSDEYNNNKFTHINYIVFVSCRILIAYLRLNLYTQTPRTQTLSSHTQIVLCGDRSQDLWRDRQIHHYTKSTVTMEQALPI
jgi:hypothetical protein